LLAVSCWQSTDDFGSVKNESKVPNNLFIQPPRSFAINTNKSEVLIPFNYKSLLVYNYEEGKIVTEYKVDTLRYQQIYSKYESMYPDRNFLDPFKSESARYSPFGLVKIGDIYFSEQTNSYQLGVAAYLPYSKNTDTAKVNVNDLRFALLSLNEDVFCTSHVVKDTFDYVANFTLEFPFYRTDSILYVSELSFTQNSSEIPLLAKYNISKSDSIIKYKSDIEIFYDAELHGKTKLTTFKRAFDVFEDQLYFTEGNYIYNLNSLEKVAPILQDFKIASFMVTEDAVYTVLYIKSKKQCKLVKWDRTMQKKLKESKLSFSNYIIYNFANQNLYSIEFNKDKEVIFKSYNM